MSRTATAAVVLLTLALVDVTQQRPKSYGNLKVCPPGQNCGTYAVESELHDGKMYYVLKHYPEEGGVAVDRGPPAPLTVSKPGGGGVKPFNPIYIIGGPVVKCPEGQLPDHNGNCRDADF